MRSIRKLTFAALSALMLCLAVASGASADTLSANGSPVAVGDTITGTSSNTSLSGTFFGFAQTISCTGSTVSGPTTQTNVSGQPVTGDISNIAFTTCTRGTTSCTVLQSGSGNGTLSVEGATMTANILLNSKTVTVKNGCFLGQFQDCVFTNVSGGINGSWSNATSQLSVSPSAANVSSSNCGISGKWSGTYTLTDTSLSPAATLTVTDN